MNATDPTQLLPRPEVTAFVEQVRRHLADLDEETREELVGGLEADLSDQLADTTTVVRLDDPGAYAAELRSAAGLPDRARPRVPRPPAWAGSPVEVVDRSRAWFLARAERPRIRPAWDLAVALRPVWWVARAWVAVTALDVAAGGWEEITLAPTLGVPWLGEVVLAVAVVLSTLVGMGRLWPGSGSDRAPAARLSLLVVNTAAVLLPLGFGLPWPAHLGYGADGGAGYSAGWYDRDDEPGLYVDGRQVRQIFAYDADGEPIEVVQLVDQAGRPIAIRPRDSVNGYGRDRVVGCPARNGGTEVTNAFPFAEVDLRRGSCGPEEAAAARRPQPPLDTLPPVTPAWPLEVDSSVAGGEDGGAGRDRDRTDGPDTATRN